MKMPRNLIKNLREMTCKDYLRNMDGTWYVAGYVPHPLAQEAADYIEYLRSKDKLK